MTINTTAGTSPHLLIRIASVLLGLLGGFMLIGGLYLVVLGGSWYYALVGAGFLYAAYAIFNGQMKGIWIYLLLFAATIAWSIWEVGFSFWPLVPRLVALMVAAAVLLFLVPLFPASGGRPENVRPFVYAGGALAGAFALYFAGMFYPHDIVRNDLKVTAGKASDATEKMGGDWLSYGRTTEGIRYAPLAQINRENVAQIEQVWTVRHGDIADEEAGKEDQMTPVYAEGLLYYCSTSSQVTAIKPSTGKVAWKFDPKSKAPFWMRCRSLGFVKSDAGDQCGSRITVATTDARLIQLSAKTGKPCESFGNGGTVDLSTGIGDIPPGFWMPTSGPLVAGDKIIIGAWVADNDSVGEPGGVIRAFDTKTGELAWAWDAGNPNITKLPPNGETYTRGTPNVWAPMSADVELGLVYLPTGNATPDYYGGERRKFDDDYNSAVVALDLATGRERWKFRTVHHDIWDYDLPSQPALLDMPDGKGGTVPALLQTTKRGDIFVLDRRTGEPITKVAESAAPKPDGLVKGERYAQTQPYSVGMPKISAAPLTEARMWGATPMDQLLCRIMFRQHRFEGEFTTQSTKPTIQWPGNGGGLNWGSAAIDPERNMLVVVDMRMPILAQLIAREDIPKGTKFTVHGGTSEQRGTPYAFKQGYFLSPLGFPCVSPPMGMITGIDLASRKVVWQIPAGTMGDVSLGGFKPGIPFYVGMPAMAGSIVTRGGVAFYGGTQDYYLRALDTETGEILWQGRLPVGAQATPMTFFDDESGRQYVVITAGGARGNADDRGDYIIAFALPKT